MAKRPTKRLEDMTEPELRDVTTRCLNAVKERTPEGTGFVILFFPAGTDHNVWQYGSNCPRKDMIQALKDAAVIFERESDVPR